MRIEVIKIFRDTPVSFPGGTVTIICKESKYPKPTIPEVKKRLREVGFCDDKATLDFKFISKGGTNE